MLACRAHNVGRLATLCLSLLTLMLIGKFAMTASFQLSLVLLPAMKLGTPPRLAFLRLVA